MTYSDPVRPLDFYDYLYSIDKNDERITVEPLPGRKVTQCVRVALALSAEFGKPVVMVFNTVRLTINAQPTVDAAMAEYHAALDLKGSKR